MRVDSSRQGLNDTIFLCTTKIVFLLRNVFFPNEHSNKDDYIKNPDQLFCNDKPYQNSIFEAKLRTTIKIYIHTGTEVRRLSLACNWRRGLEPSAPGSRLMLQHDITRCSKCPFDPKRGGRCDKSLLLDTSRCCRWCSDPSRSGRLSRHAKQCPQWCVSTSYEEMIANVSMFVDFSLLHQIMCKKQKRVKLMCYRTTHALARCDQRQ